uniref:Uncharacterized protein n=1 Tax=Neisseria meningitidis alpha522 TaxID=996307 RepID=I4E7X5_NEIME|nr:hypothetical protein NMALPHA522_1902 [Neisseria meningitidis alpha522]
MGYNQSFNCSDGIGVSRCEILFEAQCRLNRNIVTIEIKK